MHAGVRSFVSFRKVGVILLAVLVVSGYSLERSVGLAVQPDPCVFDSLSFKRDFPGARLSNCQLLGDNHYLLSIEPAFTPVNPSAWYAFQVHSATSQEIAITLTASDGFARYPPKISNDARQWQTIEYSASDATMRFALQLDGNATEGSGIFVSAQPLIVETDYQNWVEGHVRHAGGHLTALGLSVQGRPVSALEVTRPGNPWLLLIGRQHPPEITGAQAFFDFADRLLADDPLANAFRSRINLLIVPNMNPDGVAQGHWRHNHNGVDLNRDWHAFSQPETRAVADALERRLTNSEDLVFALDFHSTNRNVFYSMSAEKGLRHPEFTKQWLASIANRVADYSIEEVPGDFPGNGVFKQFIADHYGAHAVTYEVGDDSSREEIRTIATAGAEELMRLIMAL